MDYILLGAVAVFLVFVLVVLVIRIRRRSRSEDDESSEPVEDKLARTEAVTQKGAGDSAVSRPVRADRTVAPADDRILSGPSSSEQVQSRIQLPPEAHAPEGEKIRILIVDDNTGTRENVSRLLYFEDDLEVIGQAVNGRHGLEMAKQLKPHIVLMDINMPDMDGIAAAQKMSVDTPFSQIIMMSVQSDPHYMKRAMAAGARDFQPKPFTSQELVSCIRRVYAIGLPVYQQIEVLDRSKTKSKTPPSEADGDALRMPVVAVYSPKGGVGTSAVAANLAVAFQREQGNAVLFDGDLQTGDISVHLNTQPQRTVADMLFEGSLDIDLLDDVLLSHTSGLKLLLAPARPEMADAITSKMLDEIIKSTSQHFQMTVIDTSSQLLDSTLAILERADYIVLVMTPELTAIKSSKLFLELAEKIDLNTDRVMVVINQATLPGSIKPQKIEEFLKVENSHSVPHDPRLHFAINRGNAICLTEPGAPSATAIFRLARTLLERTRASHS
jgi:pilus assembly protein CpaE